MFPVSGRLNLTSSLGTLSSTLAALVCSVHWTEVSTTLVTVSIWELCLWGFKSCIISILIFIRSFNTDLVACDSDSETGVLSVGGVEKAGTFPLDSVFNIYDVKVWITLIKCLSLSVCFIVQTGFKISLCL